MGTTPDTSPSQSDFFDVNEPSESIREEHRYFLRDGRSLFCAEYSPVGSPVGGIVLCAPFAEEKIRTLRVYVSFARALARRGISAICFDYYGDGDSEGNFEDATFDDRLRDITAVYRDFQQRHALSSVGLLGLRWGGTLAAMVAEELSPSALILWEPVVDTSKYFFDHLRSSIASQMLIDGKISQTREQLVAILETGKSVMVEGYNLSGEFFAKARETGLKDHQPRFTGPALIVQLAGNPAHLNPELEKLTQSYSRGSLQALKREFEWEKTEQWQPAPPQLFGVTFDFLRTNELL
jgi:alpha/beta superfamily hydrolase